MANTATRRQKKNDRKLAETLQLRVNELERENTGLHAIINRLEEVNASQAEELKRWRTPVTNDDEVQVLEPSNDDSLLQSRPTTASTDIIASTSASNYDDSYGDYIDDTMTGQIIEHIRNALMESKEVSADSKGMAANGNVLVVYFQVTETFNEIYGYSIIDNNFLSDQETLQVIDDKQYIQLYFYRNKSSLNEIKKSNTICIVVHSSLKIEAMGSDTLIEPGSIVLWIRTNKELNVIKRTLEHLFKKLLSTLYVKCGSSEQCQRTKSNVEDIAEIIGGEYKHIVIREPEPTRVVVPRRAPVISKRLLEQYVESIKVPNLELERAMDKPIFAEYWKHGGKAIVEGQSLSDYFSVKARIPGEDQVLRFSRVLADSQTVRDRAAISKYERIYFGTSMKDVAAYIIKMVDYFHQILELPFGSEIIIDNNRDFFYGHDLGRHEHISGPTPMLEDLMEHMWDVRQGFVYIDELCHIIGRALERPLSEKPSPLLLEFGKLIMAGALRHQDRKVFGEYEANTMRNSLAHVRDILKDNAPKGSTGDKLTSDEIERVYSPVSVISLRNYWEVVQVLGLQEEFKFLEPDSHIQHKLETTMEKLVGQTELEHGLFLPLIVDNVRIERPSFRFISHWRQLVSRVFSDSLDQLLYEMDKDNRLATLVELGHVMYQEDELGNKKDRKGNILNRLLRVDGDLRPVLDSLIDMVFIRTVATLEDRYNMEKMLHVGRRETSSMDYEDYTYDDVYKVIEFMNPEWADKRYRKKNLNLWVSAAPLNLYGRYAVRKIGKVEVRTLGYIEWTTLFGVENGIRSMEARYGDGY